MSMRKETIIKNINQLTAKNQSRFYKAQRNARLYTWSPLLSLKDVDSSQTVGYYNLGTYEGESNTSSINENIIASCIDTLVSKIASTKVRPFFNTINGGFKDIKVAKQTQQFFDVKFDAENMNKIVSLTFRDACIFDTGVIHINDSYSFEKINPWQVFIDPAEDNYGTLTRAVIKQDRFPATLANFSTTQQYLTRYIYYDVQSHTQAYWYPEANRCSIKEYKADKLPLLFMHYSSPVVGNTSTSVVDMLYGIQMQIDAILRKIGDAANLNPALTFFVPEGAQIKAKQLDNRVGNVVTYKPSPNMTSSPITTATPAFIDPQYMELLKQLKEDAYEMVGISQLSATSQKPRGLDSGAALQTMEDIESDRFETQLNQVIRAYTDLTKLYMEVVPEDAKILPTDLLREELTWKQMKHASKQMNIQYSGASILSKDPETKLRQISLLAQNGIIPRSRIATLMEMPDLEAGYSISSNALNAVLAVISDCIEKDDYSVPFFVPVDMLKEEIANTMLSLQAADSKGNQEDIQKLKRLYEVVLQGMAFVEQTQQLEQAVNDQSEAVDSQQQMNDEQDARIATKANVLQGGSQ